MALINQVKREINVKLVYFGPPRAGKTTNLNAVYRKLPPDCRTKLKSMSVQEDRMLFFDFALPGAEELDGYRVRFHAYTLAGEVVRPASWKMVLKGVDGVVFVADSGVKMADANRESLALLDEQLHGIGSSLSAVPCVVQCNKRDLAAALPLTEMEPLADGGVFPLTPSVAKKGEGVLETLAQLARMVVGRVQAETQAETSAPAKTETVPAPPEKPGGVPPRGLSRFDAGLSGLSAGEEGAGTGGAPAGAATTGEGPVVEFAGAPGCSDNLLRVPLRVRWGGESKMMVLAVSLSPEEG